MAMNSLTKNIKGNDNLHNFQDQEAMELYSKERAKENEIMYLHEQIALASIKESQLLSEKHSLERKFSELRLALDEKQNEAITSASNELVRRKGDIEENLRLINELKIAEDEQYIFMSSMLRLLAEYGIWPRVTNAFTLTNSIKHAHDQLQLKIKTSHDRIEELNELAGNHAGNGSHNRENPSSASIIGQLPNSSMGMGGSSLKNHYLDGHHVEPADGVSTYIQNNDRQQTGSLMPNHGSNQLQNADNHPKLSAENDRKSCSGVVGSKVDNLFDRSGINMRLDENDKFYHSPMGHDRVGSLTSEGEGPGIEGFQIIGDAKPGGKILGCGYPVRGTSLCMFQWVRHYPDGTRQYIEGATNPEYVVTADDVNKVIAVECIPMDDHGCRVKREFYFHMFLNLLSLSIIVSMLQGDLVRLFANDQNKIMCDPNMQQEIDMHVSNGQATFSVLMLIDSSENWEPATIFLRQSSFQVKVHKTKAVVIAEKFSSDLSIEILNGLSTQFVLTCSDASSHFFSSNNDFRMRDALVLTIRIFQSKALDEKRKGRA